MTPSTLLDRAKAAADLRRRRRRLAGLHERLVPPDRLTVGQLHEACALLEIDASALLAGSADVPRRAPTLAEGQRFLDLTHPGHGIAVAELEAGDAEAVLGVAAANFFGASMAKRLAPRPSSSTSGANTAASTLRLLGLPVG